MGRNTSIARRRRHLVERAREIAAVCARYGVTLPDVAAQFPSRHRAVVSTVLGARDGRQAVEGAARFATPVPDELWTELEHDDYLVARP